MGMLRIALAALLLSPAVALAQTTLDNGFAVDVPNTASGESQFYTLEVTSGMTELRAILTGGSGDPDLFLYYEDDAEPTCPSEELGPEETCTVVDPLPGTWTIEVYGAAAFGNGVQLVAVAAVELADNVPETPISGGSGDVAWYFIEVPSGQGHLNVTTTAGNGNPNMNVGPDLFGGPECSSGSGNTIDACEIDQPAAGTWFVQITGTSAYSGVSLNAEYGPERPPNAGNVSSGALAPLTLAGLLLAGLGAALRRRAAGSR
jgi:serine protease